MEYILRSGCLYEKQAQPGALPLARIKNTLRGSEKEIYLQNGLLALRASIEAAQPGSGAPRRYLLTSPEKQPLVCGMPGYAPEEDPAQVGWPVNHLPRTDHADLLLEGEPCLLEMLNSQNYELRSADGITLLQISHRGLLGGWNLRSHVQLVPELLCGLLVFCLYLDRENEFLTV